MRKLLIIAGAVAALAVPSAAMAAVTYDDARVGSVGKGDVQNALGLNDAAMQTTAVTFTNKAVSQIEMAWACSNGDQHSLIYSFTTVRPIASTPLKNPQGKVTGWTLDGFNGPGVDTSSVTGPSLTSCPTGGTMIPGSLSFPWHPSTSIVEVNDIDLPNTPAEIPVV
jgi:hypothetical protein